MSASALSRTIRLLEEDLGQPLFLRHGRRIELNEAGERLLVAVRDAMRLVHDGLSSLSSTALEGPVRVSSTGLLTGAFVLPGLAALQQDHPALVPHICTCPTSEVGNRLLRGQIDVAFVTHPVAVDEVTKVHLGAATNGIYCAEGHPLYRRRKVTLDDVLEHPFVGLADDDRGTSLEDWPAAHDRRVTLVVSDQTHVLEACRLGELLAVLPDAVAHAESRRSRLHRLPLDIVPPTDVFAQHRHTLAPGGRAEAVVEAVRVQMHS